MAGAGDDLLVSGQQLETVYLFDGCSGELLLTLHNPDPAYQPRFGQAVGGLGDNLLVAANDVAYVFRGQVPEPSNLVLLSMAALFAVLLRRRRLAKIKRQ